MGKEEPTSKPPKVVKPLDLPSNGRGSPSDNYGDDGFDGGAEEAHELQSPSKPASGRPAVASPRVAKEEASSPRSNKSPKGSPKGPPAPSPKGSHTSAASSPKGSKNSPKGGATKKGKKKTEMSEEEEMNQAATKIQAVHRGRKARKKVNSMLPEDKVDLNSNQVHAIKELKKILETVEAEAAQFKKDKKKRNADPLLKLDRTNREMWREVNELQKALEKYEGESIAKEKKSKEDRRATRAATMAKMSLTYEKKIHSISREIVHLRELQKEGSQARLQNLMNHLVERERESMVLDREIALFTRLGKLKRNAEVTQIKKSIEDLTKQISVYAKAAAKLDEECDSMAAEVERLENERRSVSGH